MAKPTETNGTDNGNTEIRVATLADAVACARIYKPYVEKTAITFEYEAPDAAEFARRIEATLTRYPFLVAQRDGTVVGYAYASPFKERAAYDWSVETSIYLAENERGHGIGSLLYNALEAALIRQGVLNANACIAVPREGSDYDTTLPAGSVAFHERFGYRLVGRFHESGFKFNRWYDTIWMEKFLGDHSADPAPVVAFSESM